VSYELLAVSRATLFYNLHIQNLFTTHHSPLTTHHSPLTTHHSPLTTHHSHSPLTTHRTSVVNRQT